MSLDEYKVTFKKAMEDPEIQNLWLEAVGVMELAKQAALHLGPEALQEIVPYWDALEAKLREKYPELDVQSGGNLHKIIEQTMASLHRMATWQGRKN